MLDGVPADARVAVEETFGPVAPVVAIDSLEHAIELTNGSPYGLLAAIFTADLAAGPASSPTASRTGWVNINESSNYWEAHLPFGGRAGYRQRHRPGRRRARDALVHRAADGRAYAGCATVVARAPTRISRSNVATCSLSSARACRRRRRDRPSSAPCSCTRAERCGSRSRTRYQIRSERLK